MAMKLRPLYDRIVVTRKETGEQVRGGIIIPDTAKEKPQQAEVIAVGEGKFAEDGKRMKLDVKAGDTVLIGKYSGPTSRSMTSSTPSSAKTKSSRWSSKQHQLRRKTNGKAYYVQ